MSNISQEERARRSAPSLATWRVREYQVLDILSELLHWFEVALAGISVAFVAIGGVYLTGELFGFSDAVAHTDLQTSFEDLLSDILLLVVGIELALMLVRRTPESLIEVMFFVVARKMLIKTDTFWDLILGWRRWPGSSPFASICRGRPGADLISSLRTGRRRRKTLCGHQPVATAAGRRKGAAACPLAAGRATAGPGRSRGDISFPGKYR